MPPRARRRSSPARRIGPILAVLLGAALVVASPAPASADDWTAEMLRQVNAYRAGVGAPPLRACPNLATSAQWHADDMAINGYFSHTGLNGSNVGDRANAARYTGFTTVGENIALGYSSVSGVMAAWIASEGHRVNLANPAYRDVGFGLAFSAAGVPYWAQEFGADGRCDPILLGALDGLGAPWPHTLTVRGWALFPLQPTTSVFVDLYLDGVGLGRLLADQPRGDVAAAFPTAGASHGYSGTFVLRPGVHQVCAYAINPLDGPNSMIGCQSIAIASGDPVGNLDSATAVGPGRVRVVGWTFDPEVFSAGLVVHAYVDGRGAAILDASAPRSDVGTLYPAYGPNHGFDAVIPTSGGFQQVCLYAINTGLGSNRLLGCRTVLVPSPDPFGALDAVTVSGAGRVTVRGWGADPETTDSIDIHVYANGRGAGALTASLSRRDVGFLYPGVGENHGFDQAMTVGSGTKQICAYGINVGIGVNTLLGCRTVTVT